MASLTLQNATPRIIGSSLLVPPATPRALHAQNVTGAYRTLQRRSNGSNVSSAAKRKLSEVASCPERCLVTRAPEPYEVCHIIPKATPFLTLFLLERSWDPRSCTDKEALAIPHNLGAKDYFYINVNTTRNLIYLTPNMHTLFDKNKWALVPTADIMDKIMYRQLTSRRHGFHMYPEGRDYTFNFVPLDYALTFLQFGSDNHPVASHVHPFADLPIIRSHIHPYFAICNTGHKAAALGVDGIESLLIPANFKLALVQCAEVYKRWVKPKANGQNSGPGTSPGPSPSPPGPAPRSSNTSAGTGRNTAPGSRRHQTRSQDDSEDIPPTSGSHGQTKRCAISFRPRANSLPTPEASQHAETRHCASGRSTFKPYDSMIRVQDWVTTIPSDYNPDNPDDDNDNPYLEFYSPEPSRDPPTGPWRTWKPSWTQTKKSDSYYDMDLLDTPGFPDYFSDSGCRYDEHTQYL
ncbi:hypothetical protein RSAG8_11498, partial [Rhizoctonia solani AG-8 WAC10335]